MNVITEEEETESEETIEEKENVTGERVRQIVKIFAWKTETRRVIF